MFREPIFYYLKKNASPRLLFKLMQCSKYFRYKHFPYTVIKDLNYTEGKWKYYHLGKRPTNLSKPVWIVGKLVCQVKNSGRDIVSKLLPKIIVFDIKELTLTEQNITINEFQLLISSGNVETIDVDQSIIRNDDGCIVPLEKIVNLLPNVVKFRWRLGSTMFPTITANSTIKLIENLPLNMQEFSLFNIPDTFCINLFFKFMDRNPSIRFNLTFIYDISTKYSKMLQSYVDKLINNASMKSHPILIRFWAQTEKSRSTLIERFYKR